MELSQLKIIAEIGVNHNGSDELVELMTVLAAKAGADAIKYQFFSPDHLVSATAPMAEYQSANLGLAISQREMLSKISISKEALRRCKNLCDELGLEFICTAFDSPSLEFVSELGVNILKWPSGEINNLPFLEQAADLGLPIIISTGMSDDAEISEAIGVCMSAGLRSEDLILLHCTSQYPTPSESANIFSIPHMKQKFNLRTGFSDHTLGNEAAVLAVAAGADIFEKHITLSTLMEGPDHKASLDIAGLEAYIDAIKEAEAICGTFEKRCFPIEASTRVIARKSIHIAQDISKGEEFTADSIVIQRPGDGIAPKELENILGRKAARNLKAGNKLELEDIEQT